MRKILIKEPVLFVFLVLFLVLLISFPYKMGNYPRYIDFKTIFSLAGLLIITEGVRESGYFSKISHKALRRIKTERSLALVLTALSVFLSPFLTNDIALFIVIPLTLSFKRFFKNEIYKLIIFEAIGVNVGSMLTPIGNPQNIFIWHRYDVSFLSFIYNVFPVFLVSFLILIVFLFLFFKNKNLEIVENTSDVRVDSKLLFISIFSLILFVISVEFNFLYPAFLLIFVVYILFYKKVIKSIDWLLLLIFVLIFIDFGILSEIPFFRNTMIKTNLNNESNLYFLSILTSQIMSNVPSAVFISRFSDNWRIICIGGNGLVIASLANAIALRISKDKKAWIRFHLFSVPYLTISSIIVYFLFIH